MPHRLTSKTASSSRSTVGQSVAHGAQPLLALGVVSRAVMISLSLCAGAGAAVNDREVRALADLSLQDLMNVEVVSAGRHSQALGDVAAAVFVISRDDLLRSGVRAWPEALRMAPGVDVARISSSRWAIGVRGEAGRFADKLQVLVDGRSIYSPLFSGVFWESEQIPLADIERIEIIRGAAGAMWGANAVNGVINVITRQVQDNRGSTSSVRIDSDGHRAVHMGGQVGPVNEDGGWHLSAHGDGANAYQTLAGKSANDDARNLYFSARFDGRTDGGARLSGQALAQRSDTGDTWNYPDLSAPYVNTLPTRQVIDRLIGSGTYSRPLGAGEEFKASAHGLLEHAGQTGSDESRSQTVAAEMQRSWLLAPSRQTVTLGAGTKHYHDRITGSALGDFSPASRWIHEWSVFGQDEILLVPDRLTLTVGARVDSNPYSGVRTQPNVTLSWRESPHRLLWTSVSRAVRVPSRGASDANLSFAVLPPAVTGAPLPTLLRNGTSAAKVVEEVTTWQLGVRSQSTPTLSWDAVAFVSQYDPLGYYAPSATGAQMVMAPQPHLVMDINSVAGQSRTMGLEASMDWQPARNWRLQGSAALLGVDSKPPMPGLVNAMDTSPRQLLSLRASYDAADDVKLQAWLRHTGQRFASTTATATNPAIGAYSALDLSARWQYRHDVTITGSARNLGPAQRLEIYPDNGFSVPIQVPRTVGVKVDFDF